MCSTENGSGCSNSSLSPNNCSKSGACGAARVKKNGCGSASCQAGDNAGRERSTLTSITGIAAAPIGAIGAGYRFAVKGISVGKAQLITPPRFAVVLDEVLPGSPADKAGMRAGDSILKVDGELVETSGQEAVETIVSLIAGPIGTTVSITIEREEDNGQANELTFSVVRAALTGQPAQRFHAGVPKCRACPFHDQPGKCIDCPGPVRVGRAAARSAVPQETNSLMPAQPAPSFPAFVVDIIQRSQAVTTDSGTLDRAVNFGLARQTYNAAVRAVERALTKLEQADDGQLEAIYAELDAAERELEQITSVYEAANQALSNV